ncbi:MAG: hypothetical protein P9M14_13475 [Candidatus Alcyoniella australis]|nr:hypothetical protein [Candidatus Alcyoniella australis]
MKSKKLHVLTVAIIAIVVTPIIIFFLQSRVQLEILDSVELDRKVFRSQCTDEGWCVIGRAKHFTIFGIVNNRLQRISEILPEDCKYSIPSDFNISPSRQRVLYRCKDEILFFNKDGIENRLAISDADVDWYDEDNLIVILGNTVYLMPIARPESKKPLVGLSIALAKMMSEEPNLMIEVVATSEAVLVIYGRFNVALWRIADDAVITRKIPTVFCLYEIPGKVYYRDYELKYPLAGGEILDISSGQKERAPLYRAMWRDDFLGERAAYGLTHRCNSFPRNLFPSPINAERFLEQYYNDRYLDIYPDSGGEYKCIEVQHPDFFSLEIFDDGNHVLAIGGNTVVLYEIVKRSRIYMFWHQAIVKLKEFIN